MNTENTNSTEKFFMEISKPIEGDRAGLLLERLFTFTQAINKMEPDDLIALFQALSMLKRQQSINWFGRNPIRRSIADTQKVIIVAMQKRPSHAAAFNNVIKDEWVNDNKYRIY
ncbi:MAG: hypothetical protein WCT50_04255 [Patescibacteria group bacterium]|jgi:hypothetical protein